MLLFRSLCFATEGRGIRPSRAPPVSVLLAGIAVGKHRCGAHTWDFRLSTRIAEVGYDVVGYDVDSHKVDALGLATGTSRGRRHAS